jgi:hypothetical protein
VGSGGKVKWMKQLGKEVTSGVGSGGKLSLLGRVIRMGFRIFIEWSYTNGVIRMGFIRMEFD